MVHAATMSAAEVACGAAGSAASPVAAVTHSANSWALSAEYSSQGSHAADGLDVEPRLHARAEHAQGARVCSGKLARGHRRAGRRAHRREIAAIHDHQRRTRFVVAQDVNRVDRWQPADSVATEHRDDLGAERPRLGHRAGHRQEHAFGARWLDAYAQRRLGSPAAVRGESRTDCVDDARIIQQPCQVAAGEEKSYRRPPKRSASTRRMGYGRTESRSRRSSRVDTGTAPVRSRSISTSAPSVRPP